MSKPLRKCKFCGLEAYTEQDLELFVRDKDKPYHRGYTCKACRNEQQRFRRSKNRVVFPYLRKCRSCGLEAHDEQELELFCKGIVNRGGSTDPYPYGRRNLCKNCYNEYKKGWNEINPLWDRYHGMMERCYSKNDIHYPNYGGRGIAVCEEWRKNRDSFFMWAENNGFKPELSLDRIDNDGGYSPENCRWATRSQQQLNRRNTVTFLEKGTRICRMCKQEKPLTDFHRSSQRGECGYGRVCKQCIRKHRKKRDNKHR